MALTVDKFKFGNKSITDMYFGTAPVKEIYFGNILVWQKGSAKVLVAGDKNVAIEYIVGVNDITVNSISIFTTSSPSGTTALLKIIHESGLYIGYASGQDVGTADTKYGLNGWLITLQLNNQVTLYAGHKYYFVVQGTTNEAFKPAYFQGDYSDTKKLTGKYKDSYTNTQAQVTVSTEFNSNGRLKPADYKGLVDTTGQSETMPSGVGAENEGAWFTWVGSQSQQETGISMTQADIYRRTNVDEGAFFTGTIGNNQGATLTELVIALKMIYVRPNPSAPPVRVEQKLWKCWNFDLYGHAIAKNRVTNFYQPEGADEPLIVIDNLEDALSIDVNDYFIWNGDSTLTTNSYYYKSSSTTTETEIDFSQITIDDYGYKQAAFLQKLALGDVLIKNGTGWNTSRTGNIAEFKTQYSNYNVDIPSLTPRTSLPSSPVANTFYYIAGSAWTIWHETAVYFYDGSDYVYLNKYGTDALDNYLNYSSITTIFTEVPFTSMFDDMGSVSQWLTDETMNGGSSYGQTAGQVFVITPTLATNRKYYLEINGVEQ